MNRVGVIATHHKTGTVWMLSVFRRIAKRLELHFSFAGRLGKMGPEDVVVPSIVFSPHSSFRAHRWLLDHPQCRILHLIRDPRDIIISSMHYHRIASESWLHIPRPAFGGQSYQEKLNSLVDDRARYIFEMHNGAGRVIRTMLKWNYKLPNAFECRYENLIEDSEATEFKKVLQHLGFEDEALEVSVDIFKANSLFGGDVPANRSHIRSGARNQWKYVYDTSLANEFVAHFGDVLIKLGYEPDNFWSGRLPSRGVGQDAVAEMR